VRRYLLPVSVVLLLVAGVAFSGDVTSEEPKGARLEDYLNYLTPGWISDGVDVSIPAGVLPEGKKGDDALSSLLFPLGLNYVYTDHGKVRVMRDLPVTIQAYNQPLLVVLGFLFRGTPFSFRVESGADPAREISVNVQNATLNQSLEIMLSPHRYFFRRSGNTYVIFRDIEKTFTLQFPSLSQAFSVNSSRTGQAGTGTGTQSQTGGYTVSGGMASTLAEAEARAKMDQMDSLEKGIKGFLSDTGKYVVHRELGMLWVRDRKDIVEVIESFVRELNTRIGRNVRITGIIAEVTFDDNREVGVDWNFVAGSLSGGLSGTGGSTGGVFTLNFTWNSEKERIFISALEKYGKVNIVSRPVLSVVNGSVGSITVGDTISYVSQAYSTTGSTVTSSTQTLVVSPLQTGLSFYVLPRIVSDSEAVLYIAPDLTNLIEIRRVENLGLVVEAPSVSTRQVQSVIHVKKGEKILVGGIIGETKREQKTGIPVLMDLPWIGAGFRSTSDRKQKSEFAMLLEVNW
jgi:Flp pilus assembly secretin CpaC